MGLCFCFEERGGCEEAVPYSSAGAVAVDEEEGWEGWEVRSGSVSGGGV